MMISTAAWQKALKNLDHQCLHRVSCVMAENQMTGMPKQIHDVTISPKSTLLVLLLTSADYLSV